MTQNGEVQATRVVPLMRYRDLPNAITWLSDAFGFTAHYTASDEDGTLIYAQMTYGNGMVMLGPVRESDFDDLLSQPDEIGGTETQSCYLVVEDIESHFERAKEAGAEIALDVQSDDTGGRAYSCRDCEGHLWNFGTFNPWQSSDGSSTALTPVFPRRDLGPMSLGKSAAAVFAGLAVAGVAIGLYTRHQAPQDRISNIQVVDPDDPTATGQPRNRIAPPSAPVRVVAALRKQLQTERSARRKAEQRLARLRRDLAAQKSKADRAVATTRKATKELAQAQGAERAALATVERLRTQHLKELRTATASVEDLQLAIEAERTAKAEALSAAEAIKYELVLERQLRQQAERKATAALRASPTAKANAKSTKSTPARLTRPDVVVPAPNVTARTAPAGSGTSKNSDAANTEAAKKVTAVTPTPSTPTPSATAQPDTKPASKPKRKVKRTKSKKKRKKVVKKAVKKKPKSSGVSKGWPYNTW